MYLAITCTVYFKICFVEMSNFIISFKIPVPGKMEKCHLKLNFHVPKQVKINVEVDIKNARELKNIQS